MERNLIDAAVHTRDGEAGRIWKVAMEPNSRHVTHLVVHKGILFGRNVVVPIEAVERSGENEIWLNLTNEAVKGLPDYEENQFMNPAEGWDYPMAFPMGGIIWPLQPNWGGANPLMWAGAKTKDSLPTEDVALEAGTLVECADGHCGRIDRVLVDDVTNDVTGFVIRRGYLFPRDVNAPMDWVERVGHDAVHLKLTRDELDAFAKEV